MSRDETLRKAVRQLRERLGLTQTKFADAVNKSYPQLRSYETDRAPFGEALAPFALLAIRSELHDLAKLFRDAMIEDLGPNVIRVLQWSAPGEKTKADAPIPAELRGMIEWLVDLFAQPGTPEQELLKETMRQLGRKRSHLTPKNRG